MSLRSTSCFKKSHNQLKQMRTIVKVLAKIARLFHTHEQRLKVGLILELDANNCGPLFAVGFFAVLEVGDIVVRYNNVVDELS